MTTIVTADINVVSVATLNGENCCKHHRIELQELTEIEE
jgi:hypothetical protein